MAFNPNHSGGTLHYQPFVACAVIHTNAYVLIVHKWYGICVPGSRFAVPADRHSIPVSQVPSNSPMTGGKSGLLLRYPDNGDCL